MQFSQDDIRYMFLSNLLQYAPTKVHVHIVCICIMVSPVHKPYSQLFSVARSRVYVHVCMYVEKIRESGDNAYIIVQS